MSSASTERTAPDIPPGLIPPNLEAVPEELQRYRQWVVWKAVTITKPDGTKKVTKVPHNPKTGRKASTGNPEHWGTFDDACMAYMMGGYAGIGFVFTADDPFVGVDLDNCFDESGNLRDDARRAVDELQSFTERSPSGKGLHIICKGDLPGTGHCDNKAGREIYQEGRYFTITADVVEGLGTVKAGGAALETLYSDWFGQSASTDASHTVGDLEWDPEAPLVLLDDMPIGEDWKALVSDGEGLERYTDSAGSPDRSAALLAVCQEMVSAGLNAESILAVLTDKQHFLAGAALDRRGGNRESAKEWLWKYTLAKVLADWREVVSLFDDLPPLERKERAPEKAGKYGIGFTPAGDIIHNVKPIDWLIKDYVQNNAVTLAFGEPGVGKSFMAADIACRVVTGTPWRGIPVKQGTVFYINGEGQEGFKRRIRGWWLHHGIEPAHLMIGEDEIPLTDEAAIKELVACIERMAEVHGQPSLIVVDTLAANFGDKNENETSDMSLFTRHIRRVQRKLKCAVWIVHHPGVTDKTRPRGSGVMKGTIDTQYRLVAGPGEITRVECQKMKDAPEPPPFNFQLKGLNLQIGNADTTAVPIWDNEFDDLPDDDPKPPMSKQQQLIWEILRHAMDDAGGEVLDNKALVQRCKDQGINPARVSEARKHFEVQDLITVSKEGKAVKIHLKDPALG